jgi:hypothetical protein
MKIIKMLSAFLFLVSGAVAAEVGADVLLYYAPIDYSEESFRKDGKTMGIYGAYRSASGYVWEGAVENTHLRYPAGSDLDQTDITLALTRHRQSSHAYRFGFHAISSDDDNTDKGFTLFAGYNRYHPYDDSFGGSLYYTHYPNIDLHVWQAVPSVGKYLGNPIITGTFFIQAKLNLIAIDGNQDDNTYFSAEGEMSWTYGSLNLNLGAWGGTQICAVRNDGFSVYNLPEKYSGGVKFKTGYALTDNTSLNLGVALDKMSEDTSGADVDVITYNLSLGHRF